MEKTVAGGTWLNSPSIHLCRTNITKNVVLNFETELCIPERPSHEYRHTQQQRKVDPEKNLEKQVVERTLHFYSRLQSRNNQTFDDVMRTLTKFHDENMKKSEVVSQ